MPYAKRAQSNRGGAYRSQVGKKRRRGTSIVGRTYKRKGASAQASQIRTVARMAIKNARILNSTRVYLDYEHQGRTPGDWVSGLWRVYSLMDPVSWKPTMRQTADGDAAQVAYIRNCFFQYTAGLNTMIRSTRVTCYLVSMRSAALNFVPASTNMVPGQQYDTCNGQMPRLNPNIFKVRYAKSFNLLSNTFSGVSLEASATDVAGAPSSTFRACNVNLKIGHNLRSQNIKTLPSNEGKPWSTMSDQDISGSNRLYFMVYHESADVENAPGVIWHALFNVCTTN